MKKLLLFSSMLSLLFIVSCRKDNSFPSSSGSAAANCRPVMNTQNQENVTSTSATLKGRVVVPACDTSSSKMQGFVFNDAPLPTLADDVFMVNDTNMSYQVSNLNPGTTYYYRTFYQNDSNAYYGNEISFNTMGSGGGGTGGGGTGGGGTGGGTGGGGSTTDLLLFDFENGSGYQNTDGSIAASQNPSYETNNNSDSVIFLRSTMGEYGDVYLLLTNPINLSIHSNLKVKVWRGTGTVERMTLGLANNPYSPSDVQLVSTANITTGFSWHEIVFDLSNVTLPNNSYNFIILSPCSALFSQCGTGGFFIDDVTAAQ